jgi:hypothetical protein
MKIIGISGRKQAGKNTVANFINGDILKSKGMIDDFYIENTGSLAIKTKDMSGNNGYGIFDTTRKDEDFVAYAEKELWPYIKTYHFADPLKEMAVKLFGLRAENIYGNDDQKNEKTDLLWQDMPNNNLNKEGRMTYREFLEHFGTKIVRKIKTDVWYKYTINKIVDEQSEIAVIPDVRFPNEVSAIKSAGGVVLRLTRDVFNSSSESECALDSDRYDWKNFDSIIENDNISMPELCEKLDSLKYYWS